MDQHRTFLDAAASVGAGHEVYRSFYGAAPEATFSHGRHGSRRNGRVHDTVERVTGRSAIDLRTLLLLG